ncbi:MAG: translation initiation factor IF-2, partial [archaeon]|nr:translation initiation factor IF-2 [archaeon]
EMQKEGDTVQKAIIGDQVSVSIDGASVGKNIFEGDEFYVKMAPSEAREMREKLADILTGFDIAILEETEKIARKK